MEIPQRPTLPIKVKLELIQPTIMCINRNAVKSYYRGKIIKDDGEHCYIEFKYKKQLRIAKYNKERDCSIDNELFDIKIVK